MGLLNHGFDRFFGHARVMLQLHGLDLIGRLTSECAGVAYRADKTAHRTHAQVLCSQNFKFL